jgi:magnesium chelatase family protein
MSLTFPASFMLAAAMNPRTCGFWNDPTPECRCTPPQIKRVVGHISGPLLDRIIIPIAFTITALQTFLLLPKILALPAEDG